MKGGVTIPIHKEFIHPSTFGATHQGVLWQHPVPKDARFFGSNFLWAILVNVVTSSRLRKIIWFMEMARVVRLLRKATTIYDAFLRSSCHGRLVRNGMFCFFGWKSWDVKTSNALRSRHMHTTRDADWSILEDLEVWSEWTLERTNQRGALKEVWGCGSHPAAYQIIWKEDSSRWWCCSSSLLAGKYQALRIHTLPEFA